MKQFRMFCRASILVIASVLPAMVAVPVSAVQPNTPTPIAPGFSSSYTSSTPSMQNNSIVQEPGSSASYPSTTPPTYIPFKNPASQSLPPDQPKKDGSVTSGEADQSQSNELQGQNDDPVKTKAKRKDSKSLEDDHSPLEKSMSEPTQIVAMAKPQAAVDAHLTQFGYNFFKSGSSGFAPLTDIPVGPDYMIGVGDRLVITAWGSFEGIYEVEVNRNGEIVLPKVGPIKLLGIEYGQLQPVIKANLSRIFKDFHLSVNMGKLRLIKVYLVGNVNTPGDYNIPSLSTLINALTAAGGPTKNGSLRSIQVKRNGKTVETVDLYDFFLKGDKSKDLRLQPGDTIFVPTLGPVAGISGNVRRPAIYELKDEKNLSALLLLADGINPGGYLQRIQLSRVVAHEKKIVSDFNIDPAKMGKSQDSLFSEVQIQDMDLVKVFPIDSTLRNYATLDGYVLRPGNYALLPGMTIKDLLIKDNLLPEYNDETAELTRYMKPDLHPEKIMFKPGKAIEGDPKSNLQLQEFDSIRIFSKWELKEVPRVKIGGEIKKPGEYRLFENMTLRDLFVMAGNPKMSAYLKNIEVARRLRSGEFVSLVHLIVNYEEVMGDATKDGFLLQPYDEVTVRKIPNWNDSMDSYVTLKGEFVFPGVYPIYKGETLDSLIKRAGGFTEKAYPAAAKFTREEIKNLQQKHMDEVLAREEANLARKQGELSAVAASKEELEATKASIEGLMKTITILKNKKAEGRMVIHLTKDEDFKNSEYNLKLLGGDVLEVPSDPNIVSVVGQVYNPTNFLHVSGDSVSDYLSKSGGFTRDAEEGDIYILKADGSVVSRQTSSGFLFFGGFMNRSLDSGDTVVVPQVIEKTAWMRDIKDITTIISQVAMTAGVLIAAGL